MPNRTGIRLGQGFEVMFAHLSTATPAPARLRQPRPPTDACGAHFSRGSPSLVGNSSAGEGRLTVWNSCGRAVDERAMAWARCLLDSMAGTSGVSPRVRELQVRNDAAEARLARDPARPSP